MEKLESSGVSTNIASYLGAATVRIQEIGYANRKASSSEMESMRNIVKTCYDARCNWNWFFTNLCSW